MKKTYRLTVSEPWDFITESNGNVLSGCVIKVFDSENLLFRADEDISIGGLRGRLLILSTRYPDESFETEPISGIVNGGLVKREYFESLSVKELKDQSEFVLIGTLK